MMGRHNLLARYPEHRISLGEFSRVAIPVLEKLGLVTLIDPHKPLPFWMDDRERKLALRGGMRPIWMPIAPIPLDVWSRVVSEPRDGEITWLISGLFFERAEGKDLH
jgi:hypothetical protein